jgi:hypothetical protein
MSVIANDSGMATDTITVPRTLCKKRRMTRAMRTSACTISFLSPWYALRTKIDWSKYTFAVIPGGMLRRFSTTFLTASTMSMVLPPGMRSTFSKTASSPLTERTWVCGVPPSSTRATSRIRTGLPSTSLTSASPMVSTRLGIPLV